jgi:predicted CopG family antitoxin
MTKKNTMARMPKELLKDLNDLKKFKRESYADVIKRIIDKQRRVKLK